MSQIKKWFPPAENNEFTSKHLWTVFLSDQSTNQISDQSDAQKISQVNYLKNAKTALKEVYGIGEEFFESSSFKWAASPVNQSKDDYQSKIEMLKLVGIDAENAPISFDVPLAETFRMQSDDVIMSRDDKIQLLFSAIANYQEELYDTAYLHSERFRLKFFRESVTLRGFLALLLFSAEFQMEPLAPNVIFYYTSQEAVLD